MKESNVQEPPPYADVHLPLPLPLPATLTLTPHPGLLGLGPDGPSPAPQPEMPPGIPPEVPPNPAPPEITDPVLPGEHSPVRDPLPSAPDLQLSARATAHDAAVVIGRDSERFHASKTAAPAAVRERLQWGWASRAWMPLRTSHMAPAAGTETRRARHATSAVTTPPGNVRIRDDRGCARGQPRHQATRISFLLTNSWMPAADSSRP